MERGPRRQACATFSSRRWWRGCGSHHRCHDIVLLPPRTFFHVRGVTDSGNYRPCDRSSFLKSQPRASCYVTHFGFSSTVARPRDRKYVRSACYVNVLGWEREFLFSRYFNLLRDRFVIIRCLCRY